MRASSRLVSYGERRRIIERGLEAFRREMLAQVESLEQENARLRRDALQSKGPGAQPGPGGEGWADPTVW